MVMPDLMQEATALIHSRRGTFCWAGVNNEVADFYGTASTSASELYFKEFYRTPRATDFLIAFNHQDRWPASTSVIQHRQSLLTDHQTFVKSDIYNVVWRYGDCDEPLSIFVREAGRTLGILSIFRAFGEPPFEADAVRTLASIAGFVAHAMVRADLGEDALVGSEDRGLLVVDTGGRVRHADTPTQQLLSMALTPATGGGRSIASASELAMLCDRLVATANGRIGGEVPMLRRRTPWGEFVLRAYWLEPTDGTGQTRHIGITIERRVPRALAIRRRMENLPLTGREKQLCLLLAHARSRQNLADAMGVSTGTIVTHQTSIYAKLGVHSRSELLTALLPG